MLIGINYKYTLEKPIDLYNVELITGSDNQIRVTYKDETMPIDYFDELIFK